MGDAHPPPLLPHLRPRSDHLPPHRIPRRTHRGPCPPDEDSQPHLPTSPPIAGDRKADDGDGDDGGDGGGGEYGAEQQSNVVDSGGQHGRSAEPGRRRNAEGPHGTTGELNDHILTVSR